MNSIIATARPSNFPMILRYTDIKSYVLTFVFIVLAVITPMVFHAFHLAGATYLPMHIFVLFAGLMFGWRAGLAVGLLAPLASFVLSSMPTAQILPQVIVELTAYGLLAGILREKFQLRTIWALLGAMVIGRLALLGAIALVSIIAGHSYSPLGAEAGPLGVFVTTIKQSWPGIALQIALIPLVILVIEKISAKKTGNV